MVVVRETCDPKDEEESVSQPDTVTETPETHPNSSHSYR
jgi:hypothetical protein